MRVASRLAAALGSRRVAVQGRVWARTLASAPKVSVAQIKELRETSGAPMLDCKKALEDPEVAGDVNKAFDWLRKKGAVTATKKSGRRAAEGLVAVNIAESGERGVLVELNSETDFVARNDDFQSFLRSIADSALRSDIDEAAGGPAAGLPATAEAVSALPVAVGDAAPVAVRDAVVDLVGRIRENLVFRRAAALSAPPGGIVVPYIHNKASDDMGSIGVAVALSADPAPAPGSSQREALASLGKTLALQVAAAQPLALDRSSVSEEDLARERAVLEEQARASGKPEAVVAKMVEGRLSKFFAESCLLEQKCMTAEGDRTVRQVVEDAVADVGGAVTVHGFRLLVVGEGVQEPTEDDDA